MSSPSPFKIAVSGEKLTLLRTKLDLVTWPDELEDAGSDYGAPLDLVKRLTERWTTGYDWRAQEAAINAELPQFKLDIPVHGHGILRAHFVHQQAKRIVKRRAVPLLFVHGWPGSFIEVRKILPLLTSSAGDDDLVFDVVAPSLPGFGFTNRPERAGFAMDQYAEVSPGRVILNSF